jgi:nitrogen fixation NifU-like protein
VGLDDLYKEVILDHYKSPRNKRGLDGATASLRKNNPLCGDEIEVHLLRDEGRLTDVAFEGQGCSISQASASMMTEAVKGRSVKDVGALASDFRAMMQGEADPDEEEFGDLVALKGVVKYPVRIKCAVLAWDTLQELLTEADEAASGPGTVG